MVILISNPFLDLVFTLSLPLRYFKRRSIRGVIIETEVLVNSRFFSCQNGRDGSGRVSKLHPDPVSVGGKIFEEIPVLDYLPAQGIDKHKKRKFSHLITPHLLLLSSGLRN